MNEDATLVSADLGGTRRYESEVADGVLDTVEGESAGAVEAVDDDELEVDAGAASSVIVVLANTDVPFTKPLNWSEIGAVTTTVLETKVGMFVASAAPRLTASHRAVPRPA